MHRSHAAAVLVLVSLFPSVAPELVAVQALMRHGARSPNPSVTKVCPTVFQTTRQITQTFGAPPGHLTVAGIATCVDAGVMLRRVYIDKKGFMPSTYGINALQWKFESKSSYRHLMSANALAQGIFPKEVPPIFSKPMAEDTILNAPPRICAPLTRERIRLWLETKGRALQEAHATLVDKVGRVCGYPALLKDQPIFSQLTGNPHPALQDIADLFTFMAQQHLPLPSTLTDAEHHALAALVFEAINQRSFSNSARPSMIAFVGGYATQLIETFTAFVAGEEAAGADQLRFVASVSSRELHYALALYWGLDFTVKGFPHGAIAPSTMLIWELHRDQKMLKHAAKRKPESLLGSASTGSAALAAREAAHWVEASIWVPGEAAPKRIAMQRCQRDVNQRCSLREFKAVQARWETEVLPYDQLCAQFTAGHSKAGSAPPGPSTKQIAHASASMARAKANDLVTGTGSTSAADEAGKLAMAAAVVLCAFALGVVSGRFGWCPGSCTLGGGPSVSVLEKLEEEEVSLTRNSRQLDQHRSGGDEDDDDDGVDEEEGRRGVGGVSSRSSRGRGKSDPNRWQRNETFSDAVAEGAVRPSYDSIARTPPQEETDEVQTATF